MPCFCLNEEGSTYSEGEVEFGRYWGCDFAFADI